MALPGLRPGLVVSLATAVVCLAAWWSTEDRTSPDAPGPVSVIPASMVSAALTDEAIRLYAAGEFARACERFGVAATGEPPRGARRTDVGRCFEGWAWLTLQDGRAEEAMALFGRGLRELPDAPFLLRGLGVAAVHAGRPGEAPEPLERAVQQDFDLQAALLARLYDHRDDAARAMDHLRAVLEREPGHADARRLLEKVETAHRIETGFGREVTAHFVVKGPAWAGGHELSVVAALLEAVHDRLGGELDFTPRERIPVILYERRQLRAVTGVHGWASGVFDGKIRLPLAGRLPLERQLERVVTHEYAHAAIHQVSLGRAPRWLHEAWRRCSRAPSRTRSFAPRPGSPWPASKRWSPTRTAPAPATRWRCGWCRISSTGAAWTRCATSSPAWAGRSPSRRPPPVSTGLRLGELEAQWRRLLGG